MVEAPVSNIYQPHLATVTRVTLEAGGARPIRTFQVQVDDKGLWPSFEHSPGQFALVSLFGLGESVFAIASPPSSEGMMEFSVMRVGNVTTKLHQLEPGATVGVRGPYGNTFPVEDWKGKDLLFIGAGIGISPVRSVYQYVLDPAHRDDFGKVTLIYGARTPADLAYKEELKELAKRPDVELWQCIDWKFGPRGPLQGDAQAGWPAINLAEPAQTKLTKPMLKERKFTAFVPQMVDVIKPDPDNSITVTCGPPIAIKFITQALDRLGWPAEQIYTTLENRMKCGIGKCGRCNVGSTYVCKDGPVFTYQEVKEMPADM